MHLELYSGWQGDLACVRKVACQLAYRYRTPCQATPASSGPFLFSKSSRKYLTVRNSLNACALHPDCPCPHAEPDPECPVGSSQAAASGSRTKRRRSEWEDEYDCWSTDGGSGSEGDEGSDGDGDGEGGSDASWGSDGGYRDDSDDWGDDREDRWGDPYRSMPPHWYAGRGRSEDDERPRYHYCGGLDTGEPFDDPC